MLCMYTQTTLMNMNYMLLVLLYAFAISSYHTFASPSYVRLHGALTLQLTSLQNYHVVNRLDYDLPEAYCASPAGGSPPSTATLPPPVSESTPGGSSYPSPPVSDYPTPPSSYGTPNTPPVSANPGSPASYQPSPGLSPPCTPGISPPYGFEPSPGLSPPYGNQPSPGMSPPSSYQPSPGLSPPYGNEPNPSLSPPSSYQPSPGLSPPYGSEPSPGLSPPYGNEPSPGLSPPYGYQPSPNMSPPYSYQPSPNLSPPYGSEPSPPTYSVPTPTGFIPAPPLFEPPVVYPPPNKPLTPPHNEPGSALWCVAKPSVPDPIIQEAMNYACGSGADCEALQPNGECFQPDTLFAHASYALNSYWQRTKVGGGTCEFGGSAMLVTVDPSYDGCHFIYF